MPLHFHTLAVHTRKLSNYVTARRHGAQGQSWVGWLGWVESCGGRGVEWRDMMEGGGVDGWMGVKKKGKGPKSTLYPLLVHSPNPPK